MAVIGKIKRPITGQQFMKRLIKVTATGPASDTTVTAGSTGSITLQITLDINRNPINAGIASISGLPSGVYITSFSIDPNNRVVNVGLYNSNSSDVTITAGSVSAVLLVEA